MIDNLKIADMKTWKSILWLGLIALLAIGCEKEPLLEINDNDPVLAAVVSTEETDLELRSAFTEDEWDIYRQLLAEAAQNTQPGYVVMPVMTKQEVGIEYAYNRPPRPDVIITSGEGVWQDIGETHLYEKMLRWPESMMWEGEGRMKMERYGCGLEPDPMINNLSFVTRPLVGKPDGNNGHYNMTSWITFRSGSGEFLGSFGEGLRKIVFSPVNELEGRVLVIGYVYVRIPVSEDRNIQ